MSTYEAGHLASQPVKHFEEPLTEKEGMAIQAWSLATGIPAWRWPLFPKEMLMAWLGRIE